MMEFADWQAHEFLRERWREAAGLKPSAPVRLPGADVLAQTEWCEEFERLQRNRLIMGALRYGLMGAPGKPQWDRVSDVQRRMEIYRETGNLEVLVDCANLLQLEFIEGRHPKRHFAAADETEVHTRRLD